MKEFVNSNNVKKNVSKATAALFLVSTILTSFPITANAADKTINLDVDASVVTGQRLKTESFNNTISLPWDKDIADDYKNGLQTKIARDFFALAGWYTDPTKTITDAVNMDPGKNLYTAMKDSNNQKSTMADSLLMSVMTKGVSKTGILFKKDPVTGSSTTEFDYDEFEKVLKNGLLQMKKNAPKLEYIEAENEPDLEACHPGASTSDVNTYVLHYERFSNAVRWVNSQLAPEDGAPLKLAGPILATFSAKYITDFLDAVKAKNLQLDYVSWHHYNEYTLNIENNNRFIRDELDKRGFNTVNIFLSEYGYVGGQTDYAPSNTTLAKQAAFMTDAASMAARVPGVTPFNWVTAHSTAMFKNQYLWDPAVGSDNGSFLDFPVTNTSNHGRYVRIWLPPNGSANIKEVEFYDINGQKINVNTAVQTTNSAKYLTDGSLTGTNWTGTGLAATEIDLGASQTVSKVRVAFSASTFKNGTTTVTPNNKFVVKVTDDKINYTDIVGVAKKTPYYHTMYMESKLGDDVLKTTGYSTDLYGVRMQATKNSDNKLSMMVWNYQLDNTQAYDVSLGVKNLPAGFAGKNVNYKAYLVDSTHSNLRNLPVDSTAYAGSDALELYKQGILPSGTLANLNFKLTPNAVIYIELTPDSAQFDTLVSAGKTVTASSGANTEYINDGNHVTSWTAADNTYPQSFVMDLGAQYNLTHIDTKWTNSESRAYRYKIETSNDGTNYTSTVDNTGSIKNGDSSDAVSVSARFVKVTVTDCLTSETTKPAVSVDEFKVYAASTSGKPVVLSDIKINGSSIAGFNPLQTSYDVILPSNVENARIDASAGSEFDVIPTSVNLALPADGTAQRQVFLVTARDGSGSQFYTVNVRRSSSDVTLDSIILSVGTEPKFVQGVNSYNVTLPAGTKDVQVLSAVTKAAAMGATAEITQQADIGNNLMTAKIMVTAENGTKQETILNFNIADAPVRGSIISSDDFEDGDFSDWTIPTGSTQFSVVQETNNKALVRGGGSANYILYKNDSNGSDYVVEGKVKSDYVNVLPGIVARVSDDTKNYYYLRFRGKENTIQLEKCVNGSLQAPLGKVDFVQQINKWYTLKMVLNGASIKCFVDDRLIFDVTDNSIASGKAGYRLSNGASEADDFIVTQLPPAITSIAAPAAVEVTEGLTPVLPAKVTASFSDGSTHDAAVTWGSVDTSIVGDQTITGMVTDYAGAVTSVNLTVHVNAKQITGVTAPATVVVKEGLIPVLPEKLAVSYNNNTTGEAAVTWETVDTSTVGDKTVTGTIEGYTGTVSITVKVVAKQITGVTAPAPVEVKEGLTPVLPAKVAVSFDNNTSGEAAVIWGNVDTSTPGDKTLIGTVTGYTGSVSITVKVLAKQITAVTAPAAVEVLEGLTPVLPPKVAVSFDNNTTGEVDVNWAAVDTSTVGDKTVTGTIEGYTGTLSITVHVKAAVITSIKKVSDITVFHKDTVTLPSTVTAVFNNGTEKAVPVKWEVNNVDTKKLGEQTIEGTVEGFDGKVSVVVKVVKVNVKSVKLNVTDKEVSVGSVLTLAAEISPENASYPNVVWSSSDESVAKVDSNGTVIILKAGIAEITARAEEDEVEAKCTFTAKAAAQYNSDKLTEVLEDENLKAVVLDVTSTPIIDSAQLTGIKGEDKTLTFVNKSSDGTVVSSWTFNGTTINKEIQNLDLGIKFTSPKQEAIKKVTNTENPLVVSFNYHGELPGTAKVKIKTDQQWLAGRNTDDLYLYYFNPEKNALELIAKHLKVDSQGYVEFEIAHCSDYVLVDKEVKADVMPKTGSFIDFKALEVLGTLAIACGIFFVFGRKRRQNQA